MWSPRNPILPHHHQLVVAVVALVAIAVLEQEVTVHRVEEWRMMTRLVGLPPNFPPMTVADVVASGAAVSAEMWTRKRGTMTTKDCHSIVVVFVVSANLAVRKLEYLGRLAHSCPQQTT